MNAAGFDPAASPGIITVKWNMADTTDPRLRQIHAYWLSRRGDRRMPSRADIDATDIPQLLPFILLIDVLEEPRDFRFRLAGTHFHEAFGKEITGLRLGEVFPPAFVAEVRYYWNICIDRGMPAAAAARLHVPEREHIEWEGIVLPLAPEGAAVNMFLGGAIFTPGSA